MCRKVVFDEEWFVLSCLFSFFLAVVVLVCVIVKERKKYQNV